MTRVNSGTRLAVLKVDKCLDSFHSAEQRTLKVRVRVRKKYGSRPVTLGTNASTEQRTVTVRHTVIVRARLRNGSTWPALIRWPTGRGESARFTLKRFFIHCYRLDTYAADIKACVETHVTCSGTYHMWHVTKRVTCAFTPVTTFIHQRRRAFGVRLGVANMLD